MIVNVSKNWAIGKKGQLLALIPEDMKFFRRMTSGKVCGILIQLLPKKKKDIEAMSQKYCFLPVIPNFSLFFLFRLSVHQLPPTVCQVLPALPVFWLLRW